MFRNFASPHVHPSSFDSASTPEAFADREEELGTGTLTATDHGTLTACRKIYDLAQARKLTSILGCEVYFRDDACPILARHGISTPKEYLKYYHATVHCLDAKAYEVLSRKISYAKLEWHGSQSKPLFDWADLEEIAAENVTIGSGCLVGMVQRHILADDLPLPDRFQIAEAYYDRLKSMCRPGNFFVEVFPHRCDRNWVAGVFLDLADGRRIRYYDRKKLRLEKLGEVHAEQLARDFLSKKWAEGDRLVAVMNNRKWTGQEPVGVVKVERVEDFLQNECQPWCPDGDVQLGCNKVVAHMARKHGDPILISDDSHYAHPEEKVVQDIRLQQMGNWHFWGSYHRQSADEAFAYFQQHMGIGTKTYEGWLANNAAWAERFKGFRFDSTPSLPVSFYPRDTLAHTYALIAKHGRMDWSNEVYAKRLETEIELLHRNGKLDLLPYFFLDEDVTSHYESIGLLTGPGRGSAAGLLLAYLLGITHVDPIRYGLSLERFLTVDRIRSGKLPDIDQDLGTRDPLVDPDDPTKGWLPERFGKNYAQIGVSTKLKLKSSVKDVARVRHGGKVPEDVEALAKRFLLPPQGVNDYDFVFGYESSGDHQAGSIEYDKALQEYVEKYPEDWKIVQRCLGLTRQRGRHACAFVISDRPVADFLPLQEISGVKVTQYDMGDVEAAGGLKMDFLVVNSLRDIQEAIKLVQARSNVETPAKATVDGKLVPGIRLVPWRGELLDIWDLPEDQAVFRDVVEGKTETVFQFNTSGAVQWLAHFNRWKDRENGRKAIDSIEAMAAFTALDRPGPLDALVEDEQGKKHNMLVEYARRSRGEKAVGTHPVFLELLPETHGIIVFQEQLQKLYQNLTGCSGPEAEEFRTNVAKKKMEKVLKAYKPWMERVGAKFGAETAQNIWDAICTFGQYGFNKSHAVCYSIIGYACAWLKHHFPLEWWTAVLRNADKNEVNEVFWRHCGHLIDYPNISRSASTFEIVGTRIQAPISLLHGIGDKAHQQLVAGRPYTSIDDFCAKIEAHVVAGSKPVLDAEGKPVMTKKKVRGVGEVEYPKVKRGHNSLNRRVCYTLIVSGVMDDLFPEYTELSDGSKVPTTDVDKLRIFEQALAVAQKTRAKPVDEAFWSLSAVERFQMRKTMIPAYSAPLMSIIGGDRRVVRKKNPEGKVALYWPKDKGLIPFKRPAVLPLLEKVNPLPDRMVIWAAVPAYVMSQRHFTYHEGKEACELVLDVDGEHLKYVRWPDREGKLDLLFKQKLKGAVVVAALCRRRDDKPFGLESVDVVQAPLDLSARKKNDDEEQETAGA